MLLTIVAWLRRASPDTAGAPLRVVSLTRLTGSEYGPTFSPDGGQVAFAWDGEQQDNSDIYVKLVASADVRRRHHPRCRRLAPGSPYALVAFARIGSPTSHRSGRCRRSSIGPRGHPVFSVRPAIHGLRWTVPRFLDGFRWSRLDQQREFTSSRGLGERVRSPAVAPAKTDAAFPPTVATCLCVVSKATKQLPQRGLGPRSTFEPIVSRGGPVTTAPFWNIDWLAWTKTEH